MLFRRLLTSKFNFRNILTSNRCIIPTPKIQSRRFFSLNLNKMPENVYPNDQPVLQLECQTAFEGLSEKERLYAHHLSRACWYGGLIVLLQTSPESSLIFNLLQKLFRSQPLEELRETALSNKCGLTQEEFQALLVYACGVYTNMGNYKGFGDTKFIPGLPKDKLERLVKGSTAYQREPTSVQWLWDNLQEGMYSLLDRLKQLGLAEKGVTTYFSSNCSQEDAEKVKAFIKEKNMEAYNSRVFKREENGHPTYEIRLASTATSSPCTSVPELGSHVSSQNGSHFEVTRGDYSGLLNLVLKNLSKAKKCAGNENQEQMIAKYLESFETGSLDAHKDGSRHWIRDKGPVVETYIGFIETYRDPDGLRGEFEGFVAMVNKAMSKKFSNLVSDAQKFLPLLPWPTEYEKDTFLKPDFTSLDILTFSGSGIPAGICIPNYDEVRQNEGFKNVSLGNVIMMGHKAAKLNFLSAADKELIQTHGVSCFEMQVGLHELLGHGSGKMFMCSKGELNFDQEKVKHTETGNKISSWYKDGETYDSVFGSLGSAYEECRAECVGLCLCTNEEIRRIFGFEGAASEEAMYVNWLEMVHRGLEGLETYEPKKSVWLQAHCRARYVILQVLLEAGQGFVQVEQIQGEDGKPDLLIHLDRTKILSVGLPAIQTFLRKLQVYRTTADFSSAKAMFETYSEVTKTGANPFGEYRDIVMARKRPRKMFVEANTQLTGDNNVKLVNYEGSPEGLIQSFVERFQEEEDMVEGILTECYKKDQAHFQFM